MKGAYRDPVDHARTTHQHAGESLIDTLWLPGLLLIGIGTALIAGTVAASAYGNQHASVVLGKRLAAIQHFKQHDLERCKSFDFWVEKNMPFRIKQARLYISVAHLPLDLVEGCRLSLTKLRLVAGAPAWARPALLLHSDRGTWESDLKRAIKAGVDHHQLYENVPEATAHLIEVLEGATALRKAKRVDDPEAVGDEAISALQKFLTSVKKLGQLDVRLEGRWVKQLVCLEAEAHAELSLLLRSARTDTPKSEGEMMDACAAAMRAGRSGGRGEDELGAVADAISDLDATQRSTKPGAERPGVAPDLAAAPSLVGTWLLAGSSGAERPRFTFGGDGGFSAIDTSAMR